MSEPPEPPPQKETPPAEPARKRPGRVRRWVVRPFFWGLLLLVALGAGVWFFVQSRLAREKLRERLVAPVSRFLNRDVRIGSIDYSFFPPTFELRDVVIPGPRAGDPPVARVPRVEMRASLKELLGRNRIDIEEIEVLRPQVYLQVNPDGSTNLPEFRFSPGNGPRRFDVRIGHILVQDGTFQLNERHLPFHLDAKAIWGRGIGRAERGGHGGNRIDLLATAQEVVATLPHAKPYAVTVSARGSVIPEKGRVEITNTRFAGPDLTGKASGFVDYRAESRRVELNLHADAQAHWVNRLGWTAEPLAGPVAADARFLWTSAGWSYRGTATAPRLAAYGRVIQDIHTAFTGGPGGVDVGVEKARYADGSFKGLISVDTTQKGPGVPVALDLDLADLSIHKLLADQFPGEELPIVGGISGRTGGTFEYRFNSERVLAGSGRANLHARGTSETGLPVMGDLPITLDRGVISGRDLHLTMPGQDVTSSGFTYDLQRGAGQFDFRLASGDVGPLGPVLLGPPKKGEPPAFWLPTAGHGTAQGTFQFARKEYALQLTLDLQNVTAPITAADTVRGALTLTPRALDNLRLDLAHNGGALLVTGRVPLPETGKKTASQPLNLAIEAAQWQASGLAYLLGPELTRQFSGELSGSVDLTGFPDRLTGRVDATAENVTAYGYPVGKVRAVGTFDGGHLTIEEGQAETPAGTVFAHGSFDQPTGGMNLALLAPSLSLGADPLRRLLGGDLTGTLSVEAAASGTLGQPQATVSIRGRDLALQGRPLSQQETTAVATWDGQRVDVRGSLLGLAAFQGNGRLDRQGAEVAIDLRSDQLGALAHALSPQPLPDFTGSFLGTTTLAADFGAGTFRAGVRLADLRLQYQGRTVASREPVVVDLTPESATIQSFYLAEPGTENELTVHGTVGFAKNVPLDLRFQSTLAATWLGLVLPPEYRVEGTADLLGAVRGTQGNPILRGEGEIRGGKLIVPELAQSVDNINGFLSFDESRISIDGVRARMGNNGVLVFSGGVDLPRAGRGLSYQITADARDVSVRFPEFLNNRGDARLSLLYDAAGGRRLEGTVTLDRSLYVQDINVDLLELIQGLFQRQRLELAATDTFQTTTQLNIAITGQNALRVRNNVANLQGDVRLSVRGTLARPVVFGDVVIDSGGTLLYNDNQYQVQRGDLRFSNPERIDPVIDLVATTEVQGFNITLTLGGTLDHPDIHLASDANLADLEIFSLIAGSQRPTDSPFAPPTTTTEQQALPSQLARQFLVGQAGAAVSKRFSTLFRFDRFRIDPVVQAGQPVSGIGITVGKRLSKDVFITYSTLPTTGQQYIVQVEWQVRKNLTLVLTQVGDGTYAIDAQWQRRF